MRFLVILLASVFMMGAAHAEDVELDNPKQEARAQALMRELRCVACENEPISQSSAPIAEDMRARVRVMIEGGASDTEVRDWFEDRYGEFVLFRPKSDSLSGWVLWGTPFVLLVFAVLIGLAVARSRKAPIEPVRPEDI